jgi:hypothetical protein
MRNIAAFLLLTAQLSLLRRKALLTCLKGLWFFPTPCREWPSVFRRRNT